MAQLSGSSNPTTKTAGRIGDIYTNTITGTKYKCVLAYESDNGKNIYYQWVVYNQGSGGSGGDSGVDLTLPQTLTSIQKQQARDNIDAMPVIHTITDGISIDDIKKSGIYIFDTSKVNDVYSDLGLLGLVKLVVYSTDETTDDGRLMPSSVTQIIYGTPSGSIEEKIYKRYGYSDTLSVQWQPWKEITNPITYVNITEETKDGTTTYKSDKTFEEIAKDVLDGKLVIALYGGVYYRFCNTQGGIHIFITVSPNFKQSMIKIDSSTVYIGTLYSLIDIRYTIPSIGKGYFDITESMLENLMVAVYTYNIPSIALNIVKEIESKEIESSVILQPAYSGAGMIWSTIATIDDKNMLCQLAIADPADTSTWTYKEFEVSTDSSANDSDVYVLITEKTSATKVQPATYSSSLTFDEITNKISQNHRVVALYNVNNKTQVLPFEAVQETNGLEDRIIFKNSLFVVSVDKNSSTTLYDLSNLSFNLVYESNDTKKLLISDNFYWMEDAYFYLSLYKTVNMNISDESTSSSRNISLYVQSINRYDAVLIGSEYINGDVYIYKVELIDGANGQTNQYLKETKKLSEIFLTSDTVNTLIDTKLGVIENGTY